MYIEEEEFILAHASKVQSVTAGKTQRHDLEIVGHTLPMVKSREK